MWFITVSCLLLAYYVSLGFADDPDPNPNPLGNPNPSPIGPPGPLPPFPFPFDCIRTACWSPRDCPRSYPICHRSRPWGRGTCCRRKIFPQICPPSIQGPRCDHRFPRCKPGYTCLGLRCCLNRCPANLRGPRCGPYFRPCKHGYTCYRGFCCRNFY